MPVIATAAQPMASTSALIRYGEYDRISGAIATVYAAHVAAVATPSASPFRLPDTPPDLPSAISATPANDTAAAIQKRPCTRSSPIAKAISAVKIGVAPRISAIVDAFEYSSE